MIESDLNKFKKMLQEAKQQWLNEGESSNSLEDLINYYKATSELERNLMIDDYYEQDIEILEQSIYLNLQKYFPKIESEKQFYLGNKKTFKADLFIKKEISNSDHINFIVEIKQAESFNKNWIDKLKEVEIVLSGFENPFFIIISNVLPKGINRFGHVNGIIVCKPEEIINAMNFAQGFYIEFLCSKKEDNIKNNYTNLFSETVIKFLEKNNLNHDEISQILLPIFLLKILDSIIVKHPLKIEVEDESNINPVYYNFINYKIDTYENVSGLNLNTITNRVSKTRPPTSIQGFIKKLNTSTKQINDQVLDFINDYIRGYKDNNIKKLLADNDISIALELLIEKNIIVEFLELIRGISFDKVNKLKEHLFSEYHKIHAFINSERNLDELIQNYTVNNKADLLSRLLLNYEYKNTSSIETKHEENFIYIRLNDNTTDVCVYLSGEIVFKEEINRGIEFFIDQVKNKFYLNRDQALILIDWYGILGEDEEELTDSFTIKGVNLNKPEEIALIEYSELTCQILEDIIYDLIFKIPTDYKKIFEKNLFIGGDYVFYKHVMLDTTNFKELRFIDGFHVGYEDKRKFIKLKDYKKFISKKTGYTIFDPACGSLNLTMTLSKQLSNININSVIYGYDNKENVELLNHEFISLISDRQICFESRCSLTNHIKKNEESHVQSIISSLFVDNRDDEFDIVACDPPISFDWSNIKDQILSDSLHPNSPYFYGIPGINDGEVLFLQKIISLVTDKHIRIGIYLKNSLLNSNNADMSRIRSHIIKSDLIESIIKLPNKMDDDRSIWILDNKKEETYIGKIQLIDLNHYNPKSIDFLSNDYNNSVIDKINSSSKNEFIKIVDNNEFNFYEIMVQNDKKEIQSEKIKITQQITAAKFKEIEKKYPGLKINNKIKIGSYIDFNEYFS